MHVKSMIACAGLVAGARRAVTTGRRRGPPGTRPRPRRRSAAGPSTRTGPASREADSATPTTPSGAYAPVHRERLGAGHRDAGRPVRQRHHDRPARRPDRQRLHRAGAVVRGHRRLVDLGHQDPDGDGERRQQHDPAQPDHLGRSAQHRLPRRRTGGTPAAAGHTRSTWRPTATTATPAPWPRRCAPSSGRSTWPSPAHTIFLRGGTYAPSTNIQHPQERHREPADHDAQLQQRAGRSSTARTCRTRPVRSDSSIPRADRGAIHIEGDYWRLIGPGDHPRPVRHLRPGHQQQRLRPAGHPGQLRVRASTSRAPRATTRSSTWTAYGNRDPRKNGESADGLAIKEGSGTRQRRARRPAVEQLRRRPRLLDVPLADPASRTASPRATASTAGTCPNYTGDGNGFKLGGNGVAGRATPCATAWRGTTRRGGFIDNNNPGQHRHRPQHRLGQPADRVRLRPVRQHADQEPGRRQRHQRLARLQLHRQRQLVEHRRHLVVRQHRPEHDHRAAQRRRLDPVLRLPAPANGADVGARF